MWWMRVRARTRVCLSIFRGRLSIFFLILFSKRLSCVRYTCASVYFFGVSHFLVGGYFVWCGCAVWCRGGGGGVGCASDNTCHSEGILCRKGNTFCRECLFSWAVGGGTCDTCHSLRVASVAPPGLGFRV